MIGALLLLAIAAPPSVGTRTAVLIGDDRGLPSDRPLRFTGEDVKRMAAVLEELGDFHPDRIIRLENAPPAEVLHTLEQLATSAGPRELFLFYYSGHADSGALHLEGAELPVALLLERIAAIPADLHLTVLDACQSGSALISKGTRPAPGFEVRIDTSDVRGDVLISSAAADADAYESQTRGGAVFTLHFTAGLRGAADGDRDGRVTLGEAYGYAYAQTVRSTLIAPRGPQRPGFRWELTGRRDPMLTLVSRGAQLTLNAEREGTFYVFDREERSLLAEISAGPSGATKLSLNPGGYVVRLRDEAGTRVVRIELERDDNRILHDYQLEPIALARLASKGGWGSRWMRFDLGQYASTLGPIGQPRLGLGIEWDLHRWAFGFELEASYGAQRQGEQESTLFYAGPSGQIAYGLRWSWGSLWGGATAGVRYFLSKHGDTEHSAGGLIGLSTRLDVVVSAQVQVYLEGRGSLLIGLVDEDRIGALPWGDYRLGVRIGI